MLFWTGQSVAALSQTRLSCMSTYRSGLSLINIKRVRALHKNLQPRHHGDHSYNCNGLTPSNHRAYATKPVSRPKAHTGRTTTAARKAPAKSKTAAATKPASKTKAPKPASKSKPKSKPGVKPKPKSRSKAKAKAKPGPKPKPKVLTEAEKTALRIKDRKAKVLQPPKPGSTTAWTVLNAEHSKSNKDRHLGHRSLGPLVKEASAEYKALTPERLEHYNHIANQNKAAYKVTYRKWIESHTPAAIKEANNARTYLRRHGPPGYSAKFPKLKDDRQVKLPTTPMLFFSKERFQSGDFKGMRISETSKLVAREYRALSAGEKKKYEEAAAQDTARYAQEFKTVYGMDPKYMAPAT